MKTLEFRQTSRGTPDAIWSLLADGPAWARWGAWSSAEVEGGSALGPGAVRTLVARGFTVRERITTWEPGERLGYELVDGMNARGYESEITLGPSPEGGTVITWRSTYERADPFTAIVLRLAIRDACKRLARAGNP